MQLFKYIVPILSTQDYYNFTTLYTLAYYRRDKQGGRNNKQSPDRPALFAEQVLYV